MRNFTFSGSPAGVSQATDCAIRRAAWAYGKKLLPRKKSFKTLFDALQLDACGVTPPDTSRNKNFLSSSKYSRISQRILTVRPRPKGPLPVDTFDSLHAAVLASRTMSKPLTIALAAGTHFLGETLHLGPEDSGITIRNVPGENAVVSGGVNLTVSWRPSSACTGCWETNLSGQVRNVPGLRRNGVREIRARFPNHDPEMNAVIDGTYLVHDGRAGMVNTSSGLWITKGGRHTRHPHTPT